MTEMLKFLLSDERILSDVLVLQEVAHVTNCIA